ncbi:hypothetical protein GGR53DRAFT_17955 [Hypoxylon sp. FL1150]|nr:hypothetical protein GGR53DRAFT_17955 [Hypoxylon sp. FL1150]
MEAPSHASEPSPTVGRRHQACERCWKRKQKCDRLLPFCTACGDLGLECKARSRDPDAFAEGHLSHSAVTSYVESLKRKINHAESSQRKCARIDDGYDTRSRGGETPSERDQEAVSPSLRRDQSIVTSDDIVDGSVRATLGGDESEDVPRGLSAENIIMAAVALDGPDPSRSVKSDSILSSLMPTSLQPLILRRETTATFMTLFLDELAMLYPHLDPESLKRQYENVITDHSHPNVIPTSIEKLNVFMALATGSFFSPESARLDSFRMSLHAMAMEILDVVLKSGDGVSMIQGLLALTIFSTFCPQGGSAWHLVGATMRKCISLGLHREPPEYLSLSEAEIDRRRRLFWSTYIIDRSLSSVMDRPFVIQDEDISCSAAHTFWCPRILSQ